MPKRIAGEFDCKDARVTITPLGKRGMYIALIEPVNGDSMERSNLTADDVRDIKEYYKCS